MSASDDLLRSIETAIRDHTSEMLRVYGPGAAASAMITYMASSATSVQLAGPNALRRGFILVNTDSSDLWLRYGITATTASGGWTYRIPGGTTFEMPSPMYGGRIDGIWTAAGTGVAEITEY